jgi:hypothetical protein
LLIAATGGGLDEEGERVGWREREYARFRADERRVLYGSGSDADGFRTPVERRRVAGRGAAGLLVALAISAVTTAVSLGYLRLPAHGTAAAVVRPALPRDVVRIRWRTTDITPAATGGRICISMNRHGRVCAIYAVGEKPADVLMRRLASLGLRVESS